MLCLPPFMRYIDEPFNSQTGITEIPQNFLYIPEDSDSADRAYRPVFNDLLAGKSHFRSSLLPQRDQSVAKQLARRLLHSRTALAYQRDSRDPRKTRPVIKDPLACFSAAYLHHRLGYDTVIIVRHPASTIASFKRLGWHFSLKEIGGQSELVRRHLEGLLPTADQNTLTPVQGWSYVWLAIYKALSDFADTYPDMIVVLHTELSRNPDTTFAGLYEKLRLPYSDDFRTAVRNHTSAQNPADAPTGVAHALKRDSAQAMTSWKRILEPKEVDEIRELTRSVSDRYFDSSDW